MPGIGGVELARAVKASEPNTDFIWITACGCHNLADECSRLGILVCLDKPLEIREICRTVRKALQDQDNDEGGSNRANRYLEGRQGL